jgi:hypothetical protein
MRRRGESNRCDLEATRREFETQLALVQARSKCGGGGKAGVSAVVVKTPKFDRSTSWTVFRRQFEAATDHNGLGARRKAMHLLAIMQGQAADILHSVPAGGTYEDIVGTLKSRY